MILFSVSSFAATAQSSLKYVYSDSLFAKVKTMPAKQRVETARLIAKKNCRKMTEADANQSFNDLTNIAKNLHDLPLECAVYDMRADYYSTNNNYNQLSTKYYDDAIQFARDHDLELETGIYLHRKAIYYLVYKQNTAACRYFLLSDDIFRHLGYNNVPGIGLYFSETANFYYSLNDYDNARYNLNMALRYPKSPGLNKIDILNTIGLTYRNTSHYNVAMGYFNIALNLAQTRHDTVWAAITNGNIGSVYFLQHRYAQALPLIETDYAQSLKYDQKLNASIALLRLVAISMDARNYSNAALQLDKADKLLSRIGADALTYRAKYFELKALLYEQTGKPAEALQYRKSFQRLRDSVASRDNIVAIERVRLRWETEKSRAELSRLQIDEGVKNFKQNAIIIVLLLLMVITILIYNRQRLKGIKDKELLEAEKRRVDEELKNASLALHGYTENLMQKNILIEGFKSEVEQLQLKFNHADGASILEKLMQAHIMTDENWAEFKKLFSKVHPTFFYNLRNQFSHLTDTDVRLLALMKLRLNNKEVAGMLGITVDGVKKAKQRLRKKMDLAQGIDFENIISDF